MTRIAAVLAAALVASGCIITSDDDEVGSVIVYWDFLRYAPATATASDGFILYDAALEGVANSACPESRVDTVEIIGPNGTITSACITASQSGTGVQGLILDVLPEGTVRLQIRGWRGNDLLWDGVRDVEVVGGQERAYTFDVDPVAADLDAVAFFTNTDPSPDHLYTTCNEAQNPEIDYRVWDSTGTLVLEDTVVCPAGASAVALPVLVEKLDLDTYTFRMQGYVAAFTDPVFDTCVSAGAKYLAYEHYQATVEPNPLEIDLWSPPACTPAP